MTSYSPLAKIGVMPRFFAGALLVFGVLNSALGEELEWSEEIVYQVTITTSFDIPKENNASKIRVIHALPVENRWSEGEEGSAGRNIKTTPDGGRIKKDRESGGSYIEWEERIPANGGHFKFSTTYETTSAKRWPSEETLKDARWRRKTVERVQGAHHEVVKKAEELIKEDSPVEAFKKFSKWMRQRITYDASVPNNGVDDTMANGAGHCGHQAGVILQFAKLLGIESRPSGGSSLRRPDGGIDGTLFSLRPTWSNTHAWIELNFPGVGWVDAEPVGEDNMFEIPRHYVKTRGITQNYKAELLEGGAWERTVWEPKEEGVGFFSPVGERNVITFRVLDDRSDTEEKHKEATGESRNTVAEGDNWSGEEGVSGEDGSGDATATTITTTTGGGEGVGAPRSGSAVQDNGTTGRLMDKTTFQLKRNGFLVGEITVPKGSEVKIIEKLDTWVLVKRGVAEPKWLDGGKVEVDP